MDFVIWLIDQKEDVYVLAKGFCVVSYLCVQLFLASCVYVLCCYCEKTEFQQFDVEDTDCCQALV